VRVMKTQDAALRHRPARRAAVTVRTAEHGVVLVARRWVRLPGTCLEVYLFGKTGALHLHRRGGPFSGWSLPPTVYVRRTTPHERG
jgi:hypothetical protein